MGKIFLEKTRKNIENKKIEIEYFELKESDDFKLNIGNLKNELENKYDLLIICNPNNPTGKFLKLAQLLYLIHQNF